MTILYKRNTPLEFLSVTLPFKCLTGAYFLKSRIFVLHCTFEACFECRVLNGNDKTVTSVSVSGIGKLILCPVPILVILLHQSGHT